MQAYPLEHEDVVCTADLDMADVPDATIKPYPGGRGMLDKLPVELLRMIIEYLVPTGCTYSFFMADRRNNYPEPRSFCSVVHQMVPVWRSKKRDDQDIKEQVADGMDQMASDLENDYDPYFSDNETYEEMSQEDNKLRKETIQKGSAHMALASVNRTFQDLVYTRFYGGNTFVFHLSTYPFTRIDLETGDLQDRLWLSWSRVLIRNVWPPGPLGPITARAARYFGDAKLIIVAPSEDTSDAEAMTYLAQVVDSAISLLLPTDPISEEQEKQQQPNISLHLQFSSPSPFHVKKKIVTLQAGVNRVTRPMDIGPGTWSGFGGQSLEQPPVENKLDLVIQPLRKLRGLVKDMCVYGYEISLDFLDEVGLVCVDKAKRTPTPAEHYHSRASTKTNAESGVPTPQYQLEAMGWTFFKAMERSKRSDRSGTTPSPTPTTKSTGTNRVIRIPSQYGIGPWSP